THCYVHRHSLPALWRGKCSISKIGLFVNRGRKLNTKLDLAQLSEIAVLAAQIDLSGEYSLYQYRDIDKREIDFIVEDADGNLAGVEVKAGAGVGKNDFRHLEWFREHLTKGRRFVGIVLYSGSETLSFGNGMLAVPMSVLWS
ncbi:MAG: ATP-binding protein, partial [Kiritimatiellae bacterium]|nr:ATP-binding protein [Kiritimatiellia bacterium]